MNGATRDARTERARCAKGTASRCGIPAWLLVTGAVLANAAFADVSLVSVTSEGTKGNGQSTRPDVSGDGRYVVFGTAASTLRPGSNLQVVVKDMVSGSINLISKAPDGTPGDAPSSFPMTISADGRYVAFPSYASNLVAGDSTGSFDLFWHDQVTGETKMINVAPDGSPGNGTVAFPAISGNGQYVAFRSDSTNLTADVVSGNQVYVRDMFADTTILVSRNASGSPQGGGEPDIDNLGRWVSYRASPGNSVWAVDTWNCTAADCTVIRADLNNAGNPVPGHTSVLFPKISGNGEFVTWESNAVGYVDNDTNGQADIFVRDFALSQTYRVSLASNGAEANGFSYTPDISDDGRFVSFTSNATNLASADTNLSIDVFVHDRQTGETVRVSEPNEGGNANAGADFYARIAGNGAAVAFDTNSSNLLPEDTDSTEDVYLASLVPPNQPPIANPGLSRETAVGEFVRISGLGSSDDTTGPSDLIYSWTLKSKPQGSLLRISSPYAVFDIRPDLPGTYVLELVVTDENGLQSTPAEISIDADIDPSFVYETIIEGRSYLYYDDFGRLRETDQSGALDNANGIAIFRRWTETEAHDYVSRVYVRDRVISLNQLFGNELETIFSTEIPAGDWRFYDFKRVRIDAEDSFRMAAYAFSDDLRIGHPNAIFRVDTDGLELLSTVQSLDGFTIYSSRSSPTRNDDIAFVRGTKSRICLGTQTYVYPNGATTEYCVANPEAIFDFGDENVPKILDNTIITGPSGELLRNIIYVERTQSGELVFNASWANSEGQYENGIFRYSSGSVAESLLPEDSIVENERWFITELIVRDEKILFTGQLFVGNYEYDRGLFEIGPDAVNPVITKRSSFFVPDTVQFSPLGIALNGYPPYYDYDNSERGAYWLENGRLYKIATNGTPINSVDYKSIALDAYQTSSRTLDDKSVLLRASQEVIRTYTSSPYSLSQEYPYSNIIARFDTDRDGRGDDVDNCPLRPNEDQADSNENGVGDVCEDSDDDGTADAFDNCPLFPNEDQANDDGDNYGNACDLCPDLNAESQADLDGDKIGDLCDLDIDGDGIDNVIDNCPYVDNDQTADLDSDGEGDACDVDIDGDGIANSVDGQFVNGAFLDESETTSSDFTDIDLGGNSFGSVVNPGNLDILIYDSPNPIQGLMIQTLSGSGQARLKMCDFRGPPTTIELVPDSSVPISCGSIELQPVRGHAFLLVEETVLIHAPEGTSARMLDTNTSEIFLDVQATAGAPVTMVIDPDTEVIMEGDTLVHAVPEPSGQYVVENDEASVNSITVVSQGIELAYEPGDVGLLVAIDIKPDSMDNTINLGSKGVIPVAILSDASFDATEIDPLTVSLASSEVRLKGKGTPATQTDDVNGDGLIDLVVQVETENLVLQPTDSTAKLTGSTYAGLEFIGEDIVTIVN